MAGFISYNKSVSALHCVRFECTADVLAAIVNAVGPVGLSLDRDKVLQGKTYLGRLVSDAQLDATAERLGVQVVEFQAPEGEGELPPDTEGEECDEDDMSFLDDLDRIDAEPDVAVAS